jgi:glycosyltransferase involved in cell wall biosynthesis
MSGSVNTDKDPLFSVVMNCYNSATYLREAIDSVLDQTYQNWEIVFWDNRSTDESAEIFNSYDDERLRYFLAPKFTKLGHARNLAVAHATGEWLGFLDCDDIWLPEKLESQVNIIILEESNLGLVFGQCLSMKSSEEVRSKWASRQHKYANETVLKTLPEGDIFERLLKFNFIPLVTAVVSKLAYHEVGGISAHFEQGEDYELFVKLAAQKKVRAVQDVVALYRIHEGNNSIGNEEKGFKEILEIVGKYLPDTVAKNALRYQSTNFALMLIKGGNLKRSLHYFINRGSFLYLLVIIVRKFTRVI